MDILGTNIRPGIACLCIGISHFSLTQEEHVHPMNPPRRHRAPVGGGGLGGVTATGPEDQAQGSKESLLEKGVLHLPLEPPRLAHNGVGGLSALPGRDAWPWFSWHPHLPASSPPSQAAPELLF